jgi:hypothetical protein
MGKNKASSSGGGGSGGGGGGGPPILTLEQFADSLVGGGTRLPLGGGAGGKDKGGGGKGGGSKGSTNDNQEVGGLNPEAGVEVARWDGSPRVHLLRFMSAAAQRDAMVRGGKKHETSSVERVDMGKGAFGYNYCSRWRRGLVATNSLPSLFSDACLYRRTQSPHPRPMAVCQGVHSSSCVVCQKKAALCQKGQPQMSQLMQLLSQRRLSSPPLVTFQQARPSIFLEDLALHGTIVDRIPSGQRGGVGAVQVEFSLPIALKRLVLLLAVRIVQLVCLAD